MDARSGQTRDPINFTNRKQQGQSDKMSQLNFSMHVDAPIDQVFEQFSNFPDAAEMIEAIKRIEMITDGPTRVGSKFKETRVMFGREATETMEVTEFTRNKSYTLSADSCGSRFDSTFRFEPDDDGTRVEMEIATQANSFFAKIMWPLGLLMMPSMKKMIQTDMDQVKAVCEAR